MIGEGKEEMAHAERCPVCYGGGQLNKGFWEPSRVTVPVVPSMQVCHGCGGKGWVEVSDDKSYGCTIGWPEPETHTLQYVPPEDIKISEEAVNRVFIPGWKREQGKE